MIKKTKNKIWDYSIALENIKHINIKKKYGLFINGKFVKPLSNKYFSSKNPANEKIISNIAEANSKDVDKAVLSAKKAFKSWSNLKPSDRAKFIFRIARMIQERAKEFAIIESLDGGKPIRESRDIDIPLASNHFFYYAGWADKLDFVFPNKKVKPLGVIGQIIPWNFPLLMAAWKIAPALATGNTVVLKPAETTSLTALKLAEVIEDSGIPPGVINIITGASKTGSLIVNHNEVDKIAFTGSNEVGKDIYKSISATNKRLTLELGGKGANIIFEDAAINQAIEGIVNAIFFNQGHVCCAGSRLFIQESISNQVINKLKDRISQLIVGDPLDKNTDIGAINSLNQLKVINNYIDIGIKEGGEIYQPNYNQPKKGFWCPPTLFLNVTQSHKIVQEEIFGPVLTIQTFRTIDEVIEKANNTPFGLSAGVWTEKGSKILKLSKELKAGVVWANTYNKFDPSSPFGGFKESGIGREGGVQGLKPYIKFNNG